MYFDVKGRVCKVVLTAASLERLSFVVLSSRRINQNHYTANKKLQLYLCWPITDVLILLAAGFSSTHHSLAELKRRF